MVSGTTGCAAQDTAPSGAFQLFMTDATGEASASRGRLDVQIDGVALQHDNAAKVTGDVPSTVAAWQPLTVASAAPIALSELRGGARAQLTAAVPPAGVYRALRVHVASIRWDRGSGQPALSAGPVDVVVPYSFAFVDGDQTQLVVGVEVTIAIAADGTQQLVPSGRVQREDRY
jgi:hypothetical protein